MTKEELIKELIDQKYLKTPLIIEAFQRIDRKDFVPENLKNQAYVNEPLPIGYGQTISQPLTVAFMLEQLRPMPGEEVLEIGAGSGWQTALLAYIVGKEIEGVDKVLTRRVVAIERVAELFEFANKNISKYNFIKRGLVELVLADGSKGSPPEHVSRYGFDKIIAAASAEEIPVLWRRQLKVGGRIVAPVKTSIVVLDKKAPNKFIEKEYPGFAFVPLVEG